MNFSASEYWTDGWRENSLMPNDKGLRQCICGRFVLTRDLVRVKEVEQSELQFMNSVSDEELSVCIAKASNKPMEISARLRYWKHLNHPYRDQYRKHRKAEETEIREKWEAEHPDRRCWIAKKIGRSYTEYKRPESSPFTFSEFIPSQEKELNMCRLIEIFLTQDEVQNGPFVMDLVELYREMGVFEEAKDMLSIVDKKNDELLQRLLGETIDSRAGAPIRYHY